MLSRSFRFVAVVLFLSAGISYAAVPRLINFQGKLTDAAGAAVKGSKSMVFTIYDAETEGSTLWTETHAVTMESNGIYNVSLGSVETLNLDFGTAYWLGVKVGEDAEMTPRFRIVPSAYAFYAIKSGTANFANSVEWSDISNRPAGLDDGDDTGSAGADSIGNYHIIAGTITVTELASNIDASGKGFKATDSLTLSGKSYDAFVSTSGGVMSGSLNLSGNKITNLGAPTADSDAATKIYVDDLTGGEGIFASTNTFTGQNTFSNMVTVSSSVYVVGYASATAFYGNGSNLTGIGGGDVYKASSNTFTGQNTFSNMVTVSSSVYVVGYASATVFYGDGSKLTGVGGGGGDVYKASSNTFTGQNTFSNMVTISSVIVVQDIRLNSNAIKNSAGNTVFKSPGTDNIFIGENAGLNNSASFTIAIGENAGYNNSTSNNVFVGNSSGFANSGQYNTFIGHGSGNSNAAGADNTFVGHHAGYNNTTGADNTFLGYQAGYTNNSSNNTFLGHTAGYDNDAGDGNTFIGNSAGYKNISGNNNVFSGWSAGYYATTGSQNTALGWWALLNNQTGSNNTILGSEAGLGANTFSISNNTLIGNKAGFSMRGSSNTFLGESAGHNNITGNLNVFLGAQAGFNETGSNKLYISNSDTASPLIYGEFDNNILQINGDLTVQSSATVQGTLDVNNSVVVQGTLDVNNSVVVQGTVTAQAFTLSVGATSYYMVPPATFFAANGSTSAYIDTGAGGFRLMNNNGAFLIRKYYAPVNLPHGAVMTEIKMYYYRDDSSAGDVVLNLKRKVLDPIAGSTDLATIEGTGTGTNFEGTTTSIANPQIDNSICSYQLEVILDPNNDRGDVRLQSVRIQYYVMQL